jgi:hypothetical protein
LRSFRKFDQKYILDEIDAQLQFEPNLETRNRKMLRPNDVAEWELRIDRFRAFYDVQDRPPIVKIVAVGYKRGSKLFIRGQEYEL